MEREFQFTFSAEVEQERKALRTFILDALQTNTLASIRAAQDRLREWLQQHPEDYVMRDAGEPLALSEDALLTEEAESVVAHAS